MNNMFYDVRAFHVMFGHRAPGMPTMQTEELIERRARWIESEVRELRDATNIAEQVDAYVDVIYFAMGGIVECGVLPGKIWELVHGANMAKVWPDGSVKKDSNGKVIKPTGWVAPDAAIAAEVERQANG